MENHCTAQLINFQCSKSHTTYFCYFVAAAQLHEIPRRRLSFWLAAPKISEKIIGAHCVVLLGGCIYRKWIQFINFDAKMIFFFTAEAREWDLCILCCALRIHALCMRLRNSVVDARSVAVNSIKWWNYAKQNRCSSVAEWPNGRLKTKT